MIAYEYQNTDSAKRCIEYNNNNNNQMFPITRMLRKNKIYSMLFTCRHWRETL